MDLVGRYLAAISPLLPKAQRDDVLAEIREALASQMEEREAELGRKLTLDESELIVKAFGNPMAVAARYRPKQMLIGPETFAYYWPFIVFGLAIVAIVHLTLIVVHSVMMSNPGPMIAGTIGNMWETSIIFFGVTTAVAAVFEHYGITRQIGDAWRPRDLPPPTHMPARGPYHRVSEIVLSMIGIVWLIGGFNAFGAVTTWGIPAQYFQLSPAAEAVRWPLVAMFVFVAAVASFALVRPAQATTYGVLSLLGKVAFFAALIWLARAGDMIDITGGVPAADLAEVNAGVDLGVRIGITVTVIVSALDMAFDVRRLWRARQATTATPIALAA